MDAKMSSMATLASFSVVWKSLPTDLTAAPKNIFINCIFSVIIPNFIT